MAGFKRTSDFPEQRKNTYVVLILIVLLAFAFRLVSFQGYRGSDDHAYAEIAHAISRDTFTVEQYRYAPAFLLRFGLFAPVALCFRVFGINEPVMLIYPFTLSMLSVILAFIGGRMLFDYRAGLIAAAIQAILPIDARSASLLLPDMPSAFWANAAVLLIYYCYKSEKSVYTNVIYGIVSGLLLSLSFFCKSSVVFLLPFVGIYLLLVSVRNKRNIAILVAMLVAFAFCLVLESFMYYRSTGDFLHRFHEMERNYEVCKTFFFAEGSRYGWEEGGYWFAVAKRIMLYGPMAIFVQRSFGLVTLTAVLAVAYAVFRRLRSFLFPGLWFISLTFMFNFGSSSLQLYRPLVLLDRYLYPALFPATILTAGLINVLSSRDWMRHEHEIDSERFFWGGVLAFFTVFACLLGIYSNVRNGVRNSVERRISKMLESQDVLYTDSRTAWALRYFWKYPGIHDFESMGTTEIPGGSYVLIKRWLTEVLDEVYGYTLPGFYNDIPDYWLLKWSGNQAELYWIPPET